MTNNLTRTEMASVDSWLACAWQAKAKAIAEKTGKSIEHVLKAASK